MKTNMARAVFSLTKTRKGSVLAPTKWNIGPEPPPIPYQMNFGENGAVRFEVAGVSERSDSSEEEIEYIPSLPTSPEITLSVLAELVAEHGRPAKVNEIAARRSSLYPNQPVKETTIGNQLSKLNRDDKVVSLGAGLWTLRLEIETSNP